MKFFSTFGSWIATNGPLTVILYAITGVFVLAFYKDGDLNTLLPVLVGLYLGNKTTTSVSAHIAASKDPEADTASVIRDLEGIRKHDEPKP